MSQAYVVLHSTICSWILQNNFHQQIQKCTPVSPAFEKLRTREARNDLIFQTGDEAITNEVKTRIYTPPGATDKKLPLIVFLHGGGWLAGNLDSEDHICRNVCAEISCIVVSVDYRLFPDVNFPLPIDDCYNAYQWVCHFMHMNPVGFLYLTNGIRHTTMQMIWAQTRIDTRSGVVLPEQRWQLR